MTQFLQKTYRDKYILACLFQSSHNTVDSLLKKNFSCLTFSTSLPKCCAIWAGHSCRFTIFTIQIHSTRPHCFKIFRRVNCFVHRNSYRSFLGMREDVYRVQNMDQYISHYTDMLLIFISYHMDSDQFLPIFPSNIE